LWHSEDNGRICERVFKIVSKLPMYSLKAALKGAGGIMSYPRPNSYATADKPRNNNSSVAINAGCLIAQCLMLPHMPTPCRKKKINISVFPLAIYKCSVCEKGEKRKM
jgi:hypothetical protein